jgi:DNA (cytosine-5)-methyltransferase 1
MNQTPKVLDFFCGIGGLSLGLKKAGLVVLGGVDNWSDAARTYEHNHKPEKCLVADIASISVADITSYFGIDVKDIEIMVGGPPCQGFSTVGKRQSADPRNTLWQNYLGLVAEIRPAYVLIENVEGLVVMDRGGVCEGILDAFAKMGYNAEWKVLRSADYGVPQLRKRVIFLASLNGLKRAAMPPATTSLHVTVADAISDLPALMPTEKRADYSAPPSTTYQAARRKHSDTIKNHEAANHPPHLVEILSYIPDGGNRLSIPDALQPKSGFHNSYARLASNKPAVAVTSNMRKPSSSRATHPTQNRGLTVREGLRLQSFDDTFEVLGTRTSQYLQVGNAVPPLLGEALGKCLISAYRENTQSEITEARNREVDPIERVTICQLPLLLDASR